MKMLFYDLHKLDSFFSNYRKNISLLQTLYYNQDMIKIAVQNQLLEKRK